MNAIPTRYAGVRFRSRLEARWAAMFDLLEWPWEYEPIDLNGYIPDFVLKFARPLLVEIKPILEWPCSIYGCSCAGPMPRDIYDEACGKIIDSGWEGAWSIAGASFMTSRCGFRPILRYGIIPDDFDEHFAEEVGIMRCAQTKKFHLSSGLFGVFPNGVLAPAECGRSSLEHSNCACGSPVETVDPTALWREAGNRVQWRAPGATP